VTCGVCFFRRCAALTQKRDPRDMWACRCADPYRVMVIETHCLPKPSWAPQLVAPVQLAAFRFTKTGSGCRLSPVHAGLQQQAQQSSTNCQRLIGGPLQCNVGLT
jgi:hypothetical protein